MVFVPSKPAIFHYMSYYFWVLGCVVEWNFSGIIGSLFLLPDVRSSILFSLDFIIEWHFHQVQKSKLILKKLFWYIKKGFRLSSGCHSFNEKFLVLVILFFVYNIFVYNKIHILKSPSFQVNFHKWGNWLTWIFHPIWFNITFYFWFLKNWVVFHSHLKKYSLLF